MVMNRLNLVFWGMRSVYLKVLDPCFDFFSQCNYKGTLWGICVEN